jgi:hypothetical protein
MIINGKWIRNVESGENIKKKKVDYSEEKKLEE